MYHQVMRTLERTLNEMQYWTAAVRVGKIASEGRPFLAAHARTAAAAMYAFDDALCEGRALHRPRARHTDGCSGMVNELIRHPEYVRPWVPDVVSTVRVLSTIERAAQRWRQEVSRCAMTPSDALALSREVGRTARALEVFAGFVESFSADVVLATPMPERQL